LCPGCFKAHAVQHAVRCTHRMQCILAAVRAGGPDSSTAGLMLQWSPWSIWIPSAAAVACGRGPRLVQHGFQTAVLASCPACNITACTSRPCCRVRPVIVAWLCLSAQAAAGCKLAFAYQEPLSRSGLVSA
jgi:hypothetical protein